MQLHDCKVTGFRGEFGPAERAGVQIGWEIVGAAGTRVDNMETLQVRALRGLIWRVHLISAVPVRRRLSYAPTAPSSRRILCSSCPRQQRDGEGEGGMRRLRGRSIAGKATESFDAFSYSINPCHVMTAYPVPPLASATPARGAQFLPCPMTGRRTPLRTPKHRWSRPTRAGRSSRSNPTSRTPPS